jgi:O-antigen/teichoic acid export membrane protein
MNLSRTTTKILIADGLGMVISFVGITYFSRELGPGAIGIFFLFQALLGILSIPADLGINRAVMKRLSEGESAGRVFSTAVVMKTIILFFFIALTILLRGPINGYIGAQLAPYLVLALVLQGFGKLSLRVLEGELRVEDTALPFLSRRIIFVTLGVILLSQGMGTLSLIYGLLGGLAIMLVWSFSRSSITIGRPTVQQARSLLNFSKYSFIASVGGYVFSWTDVLIIGLLLTQSEVGVYEVAWRVTAVMTLFSTSISTTIYPQVSKWNAENSIDRIEQVLAKAVAFPLFFAIPGLLGVMIFSQEILRVLFGVEFTSGWLVLIVLMAGRIPESVFFIFSRTLNGIDQPGLGARAVLVAVVSNVLLNLVLVLQYGITGAAIATGVSFVVNALIHAHYLSNFVSIRIPISLVTGIFGAALGMSGVLWYIGSQIAVNSVLRLALVVLLGTGFYSIFSLVIPPTREMIIENVHRLS